MRNAGFALLATVIVAQSGWGQCPDGSPPPCTQPRTDASTTPLVAVLLFENLTGDTTEAYLAPGLTEELIRLLAGRPGLRVASRFQSRRFGTGATHDPAVVAKALGASFLLTGSVQRIGDNIRVAAELARAPGLTVAWRNRFDRPADDLKAVLDGVAEIVAREALSRLQPQSNPVARAADVPPEALRRLMRGNYLLESRASTARAIAEYSRALAVDPSFGRAWSRHAYAHALLMNQGGTYEQLPRDSLLARGLVSLEKAKRFAPNESDTWMADAYLRRYRYRQTFEGAVDAFSRAIALDPTNAEAHHQFGSMLRLLGRDSASVQEFTRALELDPDRSVSMWELGFAHHLAGRLAEAVAWYDKALAVSNEWNVQHLRLRALWSAGDTARGRAEYENYLGRRRAANLSEVPAIRALYRAHHGDSAGVRATIESMNAGVMNFAPVAALAILGMKDEALSVLAKRPERHLAALQETRFPEFDSLRDDPRYQRFVRESRGQAP